MVQLLTAHKAISGRLRRIPMVQFTTQFDPGLILAELTEEPTSREPGGKRRHVRVKKSFAGKGVFACRRFPADVVIGEIEGEIIADPLYGSTYCFDLEDGRSLEPTAPFRFLNHSCEPNCEFRVLDLTDGGNSPVRRRVMLIALDDIKPGEQLTIDYNWPVEGAIPCRCGSPDCRQWVVARTEVGLVRSGIEACPPD